MANDNFIQKNMRKNLPTVTVGFAAYNEEKNIANLLKSILSQKQKGFILKRILIISDGSTDDTVKIVNLLKSSKIKIIDSKERIGQPSRLNQIYSLFDTDYLIQTDADVVFAHENVIGEIVRAFEADKNITMCGGNVTPIKPKNFIQEAIYCSIDIYKELASEINRGNNIFTANGPLLAYRRNFIKKIKMPEDMIASDRYMYLICVQKGLQYKFVKDALVYFELPLTLKDHIKQNIRFKKSKRLLYKYLPENFLSREFYIPKGLFLRTAILNLINNPLSFLYIFLINRYCKLNSYLKDKNTSNILWDKLERTKVVLNQ